MAGNSRKPDSHGADPRSARDLTAGAPSQIPRPAAMRARDINRPNADDLAEAEASVQVVHRNWKPPR